MFVETRERNKCLHSPFDLHTSFYRLRFRQNSPSASGYACNPVYQNSKLLLVVLLVLLQPRAYYALRLTSPPHFQFLPLAIPSGVKAGHTTLYSYSTVGRGNFNIHILPQPIPLQQICYLYTSDDSPQDVILSPSIRR